MKYIVKILTKNESHSVVFDREKLLVMWVGQGPARGEKRVSTFGIIKEKNCSSEVSTDCGSEHNRRERR